MEEASVKLSLIMATFNRTEQVERMIQSLIKQTDLRFELIIVDQNQDDRLLPYIALARTGGLDVRHEKFDKPSSSESRNFGISIASSEILGFPDDDCWYEADVVSMVLKEFEKDQTIDGIVGNWIELGEFRAQEFLSYEKFRHFRNGNASCIVQFFRRAPLTKIGGFDPRMGLGAWYGGGEETDLMMNFLKLGTIVQYLPQIRIHHHNTPRVVSDLEIIRSRARGTGAIYAKQDLPLLVILRGFIAPVLVPLLTLKGWQALCCGMAIVTGRVEGYLRWKILDKS